VAKHPWDGETRLNYTGQAAVRAARRAAEVQLAEDASLEGHPMEVGPLARLLVAYASGSQEVQEVVNSTLKALDVPVAALFSTLGRTAARGLETKLVCGWAMSSTPSSSRTSRTRLADRRHVDVDPARWPAEARGVGMSEPAGRPRHWIVIKDRKIDNYQLVVPSTWNASRATARARCPLRGVAHRHARGQRRAASRDHPDDSLLRSVHRVRRHLHDEHGRHVHQVGCSEEAAMHQPTVLHRVYVWNCRSASITGSMRCASWCSARPAS